MQFVVNIGESLRPGITHAREQRNASMPAEVEDGTEEVEVAVIDGEPVMGTRPRMVPNPDLIATDEGYMLWVIGRCVADYNASLPSTPPDPDPVDPVTGQVLEVSARQAHEELFAQDLHDLLDPTNPQKSAVQACINMIPDLEVRAKIHNLFHKSTVFRRTMPELIGLWTAPAPYGLARTLEQLDATFTSASQR